MNEVEQMKRGAEDIVKALVRRVPALGSVVMHVTLLLWACGGSAGSLREVQGAKFALTAEESDLADRAEERQPPASNQRGRCDFWQGVNGRVHEVQPRSGLARWTQAKEEDICPCKDALKARVDGNAVLVTLQCGGRPIAGTKLLLSSPLTRPNPRDILRDALIPATTDQDGRARFDLSDIEADAHFGLISTADVYTDGSREPRTTVDLKDCPLHSTWMAQAAAAKQAMKVAADAKQKERASADATVEAKRQEVDAQCSAGKADSCYQLATGTCTAGRPADPRFRRLWRCEHVGEESKALAYYHKACELHHPMACDDETSLQASMQKDQEDGSRSQQEHAQKKQEQKESDAKKLEADCKRGNHIACGVARSMRQCLQGDAKQCAMIGVMFHEGRGLPRDTSKAEEYLNRGCDGGAQEGCQAIRQWKMRRQPSTAGAGIAQGAGQQRSSQSPPQHGPGPSPVAPDPRTAGPVKHCVQNPDNNCSNKKFYCDVRRENLEHPDSDTSDGHGNRVCCWSHYHP